MDRCAKARRIANKPCRRQSNVRMVAPGLDFRGGDSKQNGERKSMLEHMRIVLVETTHPGNIGGAARAMKNMGLRQLLLVNPQHFPSADATARARSTPGPAAYPRVGAARAVAAAPHGPVAMVFGREHSGLSNEELDRCNYLLHIPTDATYSSLNLAAAVQVVAYELRMAQQHGPVMPPDTTPLASADQREGFYHHLEEVLTELQFLAPNNPKHLMRRLRRLFNRAALDQTEINILRGILTTVQRAVGIGRRVDEIR